MWPARRRPTSIGCRQLLILLFAVIWTILPTGGMVATRIRYVGFDYVLDVAQHLVRPAMSLAAFELGLIARFTRNAMIDAMNGDYALVAFAKGAQRLRVLWLHAFRGDPVRDVARVRPPRLVCSRPTQ
jgi:peptide/nickel transport system permease protein